MKGCVFYHDDNIWFQNGYKTRFRNKGLVVREI
jgi:hypothetical protein